MTRRVLILRGYIEARAWAMADFHASCIPIPLVVNLCKICLVPCCFGSIYMITTFQTLAEVTCLHLPRNVKSCILHLLHLKSPMLLLLDVTCFRRALSY